MSKEIIIKQVTGGFILTHSYCEEEVIVGESKLIKRLRELLASEDNPTAPEQLNG